MKALLFSSKFLILLSSKDNQTKIIFKKGYYSGVVFQALKVHTYAKSLFTFTLVWLHDSCYWWAFALIMPVHCYLKKCRRPNIDKAENLPFGTLHGFKVGFVFSISDFFFFFPFKDGDGEARKCLTICWKM